MIPIINCFRCKSEKRFDIYILRIQELEILNLAITEISQSALTSQTNFGNDFLHRKETSRNLTFWREVIGDFDFQTFKWRICNTKSLLKPLLYRPCLNLIFSHSLNIGTLGVDLNWALFYETYLFVFFRKNDCRLKLLLNCSGEIWSKIISWDERDQELGTFF